MLPRYRRQSLRGHLSLALFLSMTCFGCHLHAPTVHNPGSSFQSVNHSSVTSHGTPITSCRIFYGYSRRMQIPFPPYLFIPQLHANFLFSQGPYAHGPFLLWSLPPTASSHLLFSHVAPPFSQPQPSMPFPATFFTHNPLQPQSQPLITRPTNRLRRPQPGPTALPAYISLDNLRQLTADESFPKHADTTVTHFL